MAQVRLLTALSSACAKQGDIVEAALTAPLLSSEHRLVLPEGTKLTGEKVDLPPQTASLRPVSPVPPNLKTQTILQAAEGSGKAPIQVDSEGGVQAKESKTRFIAPAISVIIASLASYEGRHPDADEPGVYVGGGTHISGRTLGGGLGLGMLGGVVAQSSRYVGMAMGYYGLAWSAYSNVIGRGAEVEFEKNDMMNIKFGARKPGSPFLAASGGQ